MGMVNHKPHGGAYLMVTHILDHVLHQLAGVWILALQSECPEHPTELLEGSCWWLAAVLHVLLPSRAEGSWGQHLPSVFC